MSIDTEPLGLACLQVSVRFGQGQCGSQIPVTAAIFIPKEKTILGPGGSLRQISRGLQHLACYSVRNSHWPPNTTPAQEKTGTHGVQESHTTPPKTTHGRKNSRRSATTRREGWSGPEGWCLLPPRARQGTLGMPYPFGLRLRDLGGPRPILEMGSKAQA